MGVKDLFSENTVIFHPDENLTVSKKASIHIKPIPYLEAHGKTKQLSNKAFAMGRDKHNAVIISDKKVSKHHATITFIKSKAYIKDTHSTNGTFVNGVKIRPGTAVKLKNKDRINMGGTEIMFYS